jgi:hypothetical protein
MHRRCWFHGLFNLHNKVDDAWNIINSWAGCCFLPLVAEEKPLHALLGVIVGAQ